jgi:hypothetical protein
MSAAEFANAVINRVRNLKKFEIYYHIDQPIQFNGVIPFDISIKENLATFKVLAATKEEAKSKVDSWLNDRV